MHLLRQRINILTCIEIGFHTGDVERCTVVPVNLYVALIEYQKFVWLGHKQDNIVTSFTATAWSHRLLEHRLCQTGANLGDVT